MNEELKKCLQELDPTIVTCLQKDITQLSTSVKELAYAMKSSLMHKNSSEIISTAHAIQTIEEWQGQLNTMETVCGETQSFNKYELCRIAATTNAKNTVPVHLTFRGVDVDVDTWKMTFIAIFERLNQLNPDIMEHIADNKLLRGATYAYVSKDAAEVLQPYQLPNTDIYITTHGSAETVVKYILKVLEYYNLSVEECKIYIKPSTKGQRTTGRV